MVREVEMIADIRPLFVDNIAPVMVNSYSKLLTGIAYILLSTLAAHYQILYDISGTA